MWVCLDLRWACVVLVCALLERCLLTRFAGPASFGRAGGRIRHTRCLGVVVCGGIWRGGGRAAIKWRQSRLEPSCPLTLKRCACFLALLTLAR